MPSGVTHVDPTLLRILLRRLNELESEAHAVTQTVIEHLPDAGPGIAQATVAEVASGLTDAFDTLAASVALSRRLAGAGHGRTLEIDLTHVRDWTDADTAVHAG